MSVGTMSGNPLEIWDYVDLGFLQLAKLNRQKLRDSDEQDEFYEDFFNETDVQVMESGGDLRSFYRGQILKDAAWSTMPEQGQTRHYR